MKKKKMIVSAWKAETYGIRVDKAEVQKHFKRSWTTVDIEIDGKFHTFNLAQKFWSSCPEIRGKVIRDWLMQNNNSTWLKGKPPKFKLVPLSGNSFKLS